MKDLKEQIRALRKISGNLEPSKDQRKGLLEELDNFTNEFIDGLSSARSYSNEKPNDTAFSIGKTRSIKELLQVYSEEVVSKGIRTASGGHMGYIPGGGIFASAIADYLADLTNEYAGISFASPGAVAMEHELLNWMKSLFSFPKSAVGNLTSGGSIGNMIGLTAARDKYRIKGATIEKSVVYLSPHLHHSNHKALRIIGLEDVIVRKLKLDSQFRIVTKDLEEKIKEDKEAGLQPFLVVASAGTTDTGAIDPLMEIGKVTRRYGLWLHIDAAYGGFFILSERCRDQFQGIEMADSLVVDPHKGLFLPFGLGAVLVKDQEAVFHSHNYSGNYMQDALEDTYRTDPADVSPELTKHFRALRLWLPLQMHGLKPFVACLEEKLLLTRYFRERLKEKGFSLGPEPDLTVSYFWWPESSGDENEFNRKLLKEIHRDGRVFLSSTTINGKFVIRMAVLSFRTTIETIEKAVDVVDTAMKKVRQRIHVEPEQ